MSTQDMTLELRDAEGRDWRVWFGLGSTIFWLFLGFQYIGHVIGWKQFVFQSADALGAFLEGAFAPLAFLWLVIGFFLQQRELSLNNRAIRLQYQEMRRTAENAEIQARAITANELHQRQETFLLVADRVQRQLGAVIGMLYMSSQAVDGGPETPESVTELWSQLGAGDPEAFGRRFMGVYFRLRGQGQSSRDLFYGTEIRRRHTETFLFHFGRLLDTAARCDPDGIIGDSLRGSAHGFLYRIIQELREEEPPGAGI